MSNGKLKKMVTGSAMLLGMIAGLSSAHAADVSEKDVQVAARAISFVTPAMSGGVESVVVYDAGNAGSKAEADKIVGLIGKNPKAGKATLSVKAVSTAELGGLGGARVAFVTPSAAAASGDIFAKLSSMSIVSVGIGDACVRKGHCVVGVETAPKVQIYISKSAASASSVAFSSAFLMMVKEI